MRSCYLWCCSSCRTSNSRRDPYVRTRARDCYRWSVLPAVGRTTDASGHPIDGGDEVKEKLPKLPKDIVNPVIITGVEALGRGHDLQKLDLFLAGASQVVGPEAVAQYVNVGEYFKRRATSLGIKTDGLVKSEEQLAQEQQQAQMMQMTEKLGPAGIKAVSDQAKEQNNQQQPEQ